MKTCVYLRVVRQHGTVCRVIQWTLTLLILTILQNIWRNMVDFDNFVITLTDFGSA